jgi:hypothetical protein
VRVLIVFGFGDRLATSVARLKAAAFMAAVSVCFPEPPMAVALMRRVMISARSLERAAVALHGTTKDALDQLGRGGFVVNG